MERECLDPCCNRIVSEQIYRNEKENVKSLDPCCNRIVSELILCVVALVICMS